ncbi:MULTISPECIES: hypothetical protein [unclassified Streptomyces]
MNHQHGEPDAGNPREAGGPERAPALRLAGEEEDPEPHIVRGID